MSCKIKIAFDKFFIRSLIFVAILEPCVYEIEQQVLF